MPNMTFRNILFAVRTAKILFFPLDWCMNTPENVTNPFFSTNKRYYDMSRVHIARKTSPPPEYPLS